MENVESFHFPYAPICSNNIYMKNKRRIELVSRRLSVRQLVYAEVKIPYLRQTFIKLLFFFATFSSLLASS